MVSDELVRVPFVFSEAAAEHAEEEGGGETFDIGILVILFLLMVYMLFEAYKHKSGVVFGHEASLVTLTGLCISAIFLYQNANDYAELFKFNGELFFYFVLPPIVFASGFNMYRKKFFANITNIVLFGVIGTFIAFGTFSGLTVLAFDNLNITQTQYDIEKEIWVESPLSLSTMEILLMCSLLCSSDVIAAVSLINKTEQPKLFSLVFGEGIVNDAVSIILFQTVMKFNSENKEVDAKSVSLIGLDFLNLGFSSLGLGLAFGLACSYLMKRARSLTKSPIVECAMIFCFAYLSYVCAELTHLSGIIALLTTGIIIAHYGWYNLSPQGKQSSTVVFQFLGFMAEGFVFSYLGLTFFSYRYMPWSPTLFLLEFGIILTGRCMGTMGLIGLLKLCGYESDHPSPLNIRELVFIWYAGLIRGAIAFGLVLRIDDTIPNRDVIVTTCLSLVVVTTILFGSTVGVLGKCLFTKPQEVWEEECKLSVNSSISEEREQMQHPNFDENVTDHDGYHKVKDSQIDAVVGFDAQGNPLRRTLTFTKPASRKGGCTKYLMAFDENIMKPIFIYKYNRKFEKQAEDFYNVFLEQGNSLEKMYKKASEQENRSPLKDRILESKRYSTTSKARIN